MGTMLMGVVDTAVVSRFDATHASGTALGNSIAMGLLVFGMGLAIALEPLMAQARGAGEPGRVWGWWRTGLRLSLWAALPLSLLALLVGHLAGHFGVDEATRDRGFEYLLARTPGNLVFLAWMAARGFLQSHQRVRPLLISAALANVLNLLTNLLVVDGLVQWGAAGSGLTTSLSTILLVIVLSLAVRTFRPGPEVEIMPGRTRMLLKLGLPLGLQLAAEFLVFSTCGVLATTLGPVDGNAHQIALHCASLTFMAALGVSGATSARVGEAVGLERMDLVRVRARAGLVLTLGIMSGSALCFALVPEALVALFEPREPAVAELATTLLGVAALFQFFDGTQVLMSGTLRGIGDIRFPFVVTLLGYWGVGFPIAAALCFGLDLGTPGLWYGLTAGLFAASVGLTWRYFIVERRGVRRLEPRGP
jgi:MATE family multidrug resistance protein